MENTTLSINEVPQGPPPIPPEDHVPDPNEAPAPPSN